MRAIDESLRLRKNRCLITDEWKNSVVCIIVGRLSNVSQHRQGRLHTRKKLISTQVPSNMSEEIALHYTSWHFMSILKDMPTAIKCPL